MRRGAIAVGMLLVVAVAAGLAVRGRPEDRVQDAIAALPASAAPAPAAATSASRLAAGVSPAPVPVPAPVPAAPIAPAASTVAFVDPRVPAIDPPEREPAPAQPWEIADPALYKAREKRLSQETNERFIQAANARLPPLLAAVDELRARNAPAADIERAQDKIRHLQAVRDALVRGESLGREVPRQDQPPSGAPP